MEKNSLQLLCDYGNDEESPDEDISAQVSTKRKFEDAVSKRLPLPDCIKKLDDPSWLDNPSEHQGRIRSFKHERGNWATFVYVPCNHHTGINTLQEFIIECIPQLSLQKIDDLHLSLSRTVILKHHWIHLFMKSIRDRVSSYRRFLLAFGKLKVYTNEEKTRTFVGLEVATARDTLLSLIKELDICMTDFKLPPFYSDPSFHISILWCLGDCQSVVESYIPQFNLMMEKVMVEHEDEMWYIIVNYLFCKTGNKIFQFPLD